MSNQVVIEVMSMEVTTRTSQKGFEYTMADCEIEMTSFSFFVPSKFDLQDGSYGKSKLTFVARVDKGRLVLEYSDRKDAK